MEERARHRPHRTPLCPVRLRPLCSARLCGHLTLSLCGTGALLPGMQADVDNSGTIDYTEFITATMHASKLENEEALREAFKHFDADGSG